MSINQTQVNAALAALIDPNTQRPYATGKGIRNIRIDGDTVSVDIVLGYPAKSLADALRAQVGDALAAIAGVRASCVQVSSDIAAHAVPAGMKPLPNVKNIVAVASGKGGVGKSTTAVNLALALAAQGASVGMLDADIYGPSLPMMLGIHGQPESPDGKSMNPLIAHGIQVNSIGFLIDADSPVVWRAPMATSALDQLLRQTNWHDLDYLIVDMPPGTGDIQLALAQRVPVTGAVIVTTPQDIALLDAKRGLQMFGKVGVPVLGIIENMAVYVCPNCGHAEPIFGEGGGERIAHEYGVENLGSLPLDMAIREQADAGQPAVIAQPDSPAAQTYHAIARRLAIQVALRARDMSAKIPNVVVQRT